MIKKAKFSYSLFCKPYKLVKKTVRTIDRSDIVQLTLMEATIAPNATAKELEKLAETNKPNICKEVAKHPNSPPELLKKLFHLYYREVLENPALDAIAFPNYKQMH